MGLAETFTSAFESIEGGSFGVIDGLNAISAGIGAVNQIQQAQAKQAVAGIDKEIAAEKKRDGKSKESVAKIKELEKKKDAMKRKAFEQNKKMMMAQAVAGTASSIINAFADPKLQFPMNFVMAGIYAGIGAMQLATISGMQYQGGGSASGPSAPSSVNMGSRGGGADLARSRSPSGELAYSRGDAGSGRNASNFRAAPAFMGGYRNMTEGGYVVGEQGPELFMPDVSGTVLSADDTEDILEGNNVNVSFSINAINTQGMEEALVANQGNIINVIRAAANSQGEPFLETIDTALIQDTGQRM
jgi:hypothetical protein